MPDINSYDFAPDSAFEESILELSHQLRDGDRPRFLCSLFLPQIHRAAVFALYKFNLDVARVGVEISDPMIGQLRLKWWYDAVSNIGTGKVPNHPTVVILDRVFSQYNLDPAVLQSVVEAYVEQLIMARQINLAGLLSNLDKTLGRLNELIIHIIDGVCSDEAVKAGFHIARASGLSNLIRNLPKTISRGRVYIPEDICCSEAVSTLDLMELNSQRLLPSGVIKVIRAIVEVAEDELHQGRKLRSFIDRSTRPVLLTGTIAGQELAAIKASGFDPRRLQHRLIEPGPVSMAKLWWTALQGRY